MKRIKQPDIDSRHAFPYPADINILRYVKYCAVVFIVLILSLSSEKTAGTTAAGSRQPLKVFVSILPTGYFVQRIGGNRVLVETLVQPGHSPATYAPTPKQMAELASSQIYFRIGVPFENAFLPKIARTLPDLTIADLQQGIDLQKLDEHEDHDEQGHLEGDIDPHTWLDPILALGQAGIIRDMLVKADPEGEEQYNANYLQLSADLEDLDRFLRETFAPFRGSTVYVFHPAYGYFCRAYNLQQKAITPGGKEPGAKYIARLIEQAQKDRVRVIFVQPQFSDKAARTIARAIEGSVVPLDPLAYDYITNLKLMARQITQSLPGPIQ
jgi:zinc transport system substrate-binding protein